MYSNNNNDPVDSHVVRVKSSTFLSKICENMINISKIFSRFARNEKYETCRSNLDLMKIFFINELTLSEGDVL